MNCDMSREHAKVRHMADFKQIMTLKKRMTSEELEYTLAFKSQ